MEPAAVQYWLVQLLRVERGIEGENQSKLDKKPPSEDQVPLKTSSSTSSSIPSSLSSSKSIHETPAESNLHHLAPVVSDAHSVALSGLIFSSDKHKSVNLLSEETLMIFTCALCASMHRVFKSSKRG
jgi:hypothetical protein